MKVKRLKYKLYEYIERHLHQKFRLSYPSALDNPIYLTKREALSFVRFVLENIDLSLTQVKQLETLLKKQYVEYEVTFG